MNGLKWCKGDAKSADKQFKQEQQRETLREQQWEQLPKQLQQQEQQLQQNHQQSVQQRQLELQPQENEVQQQHQQVMEKLSQLDLYVEVEEISPPRSSSLKRRRGEEEVDFKTNKK